MVLVGFTVVGQGARADASVVAPTGGGLAFGETVYGPGIAVTLLSDGNVRVQYLPTFQRWDGVWRPIGALNRSAGEWPYLVEETTTELRITRLGQTFTQAKIPGAIYEFLPQGVKETIVIRLRPQESLLSVPFTTTYSLEIRGESAVLKDPAGLDAWKTGSFHAWDSADSPRVWPRAVTSVGFADGRLTLRLDPGMLAAATFPLFVDPTWKTNASMGWVGLSTFVEHATEDLGDHAFKIGWMADNFDDGTKDIYWSTDAGSWTLSGGAAQLDPATQIRHLLRRWNTTFQAKITFTASGAARMFFRYVDAQNYHRLEIRQSTGEVRLEKVAAGTTTLLGSATKAINTNQAYRVKIEAKAGSLTVAWDGSVLLTATDPSSPVPANRQTGHVGFQTVGRKTALAVDDVRAWHHDVIEFGLRGQANTWGSVETVARNAVPQAMRTVHSGSTYNWVDIRIRSSSNANFTDRSNGSADEHYVKAGAKSSASDAGAYYVQDADRKSYYSAIVDLRSSDDFTPVLSEIAVIEDATSGPSENAQVLGYEPWQYYAGGMVNVVSGNLLLRSADLRLPGKGWTLSFGRAYNSLNTVAGSLGLGWTHSYNVFLTPGTGSVSFTDGDGSTHVFQEIGGGLYTSPRGLGAAKLVKNGDGTYTMAWKDGTKWSFSSAGKLAQMQDRNGNKATLTYDGNGRLAKVADDSGIFLLFAYDANGRIVRVGDHNWTSNLRSPTSHSGSWSNGQNAFASDNAYASTKTASATHRYAGYGFTGPSNAWITKVEACVEAHTAGDDDLGVKISTNAGQTWSAEQVVNLPSSDPNAVTCLDFTGHLPTWSWPDLSDTNLRVEVRYVKVGNQADFDYLDWIPVRVTAASRFVSYAYDGSGNLASVTDPIGNSTLYSYSGIMEKFVDRADRVLRFVKDASSRVTEVWTGQYKRTTATISWEFRMYRIAYGDWTTRRASVTDALGNVTNITYDKLAGRPVTIDGPLAASGMGCACCGRGSERWTVEWDGEHHWVTKTDGLSQTSLREYDWRGNVIYLQDGYAPGGFTGSLVIYSVWQNHDNGTVFDSLLLAQKGPRVPLEKFTTTFEYDWKGNLVKAVDRLGNFTANTYDSSGFVTKVRDKRGFNTTFTYDAHGWRTASTDPLSHTVQSGYDTVGRVVSRTSPLGFVQRTAVNANDWTASASDPLGFTTTYRYNARGDLVEVRDANGNLTRFEINVTWARIQRVIEATGDVTENVYDKLGRLIKLVDPNGRIWSYEYDKYSRRVKETDPLGNVVQYTYDRAGNLLQRIDRNGRRIDYKYDTLNRLLDVFYVNESDTGPYFRYDDEGNVIEEGYRSPVGSGLPPVFVKQTVYDALNRAVRVTSKYDHGLFTQVVEYTYDENGNRKSLVYPDSFAITYSWDADNRLTQIGAAGQTWTFEYDADHRRVALSYPNGLQTNYTYDAASRLTAIRTVDTSNWTVVEAYTYTYDKIGNQLTQGQGNGTSLSYAYDKEYALNAITYESGETWNYVYDGNDNRLYKNQTNGLRTTYAYKNDSSLSKQTVRSGTDLLLDVTYGYDKEGNLITKVEKPTGRAEIRYSYDYDSENRLVRLSTGGAEVASYGYAGDGSRIHRKESGTTKYYLYDFRDFSGFNDIVGELNATGAMKARYIHGPGIDEPLAKFDKTESALGAWYYYHVDGRGSVTRLTRADKSVANRYVYDDFGRFRSKSEAIPNPYGFTGREADVFGLAYHRARYYDTGIGRFVTRDPAGMVDGANPYSYAGNNPVSSTDRSGKIRSGLAKAIDDPGDPYWWNYQYVLMTPYWLGVIGPFLDDSPYASWGGDYSLQVCNLVCGQIGGFACFLLGGMFASTFLGAVLIAVGCGALWGGLCGAFCNELVGRSWDTSLGWNVVCASACSGAFAALDPYGDVVAFFGSVLICPILCALIPPPPGF